MSTINLSQEELTEYALEEWFVDELDQEHYKHDVTAYTILFKKEDKYYTVTYYHSYNWGINDCAPYTAQEVIKKEVVKTEWVPV